MKNMKILATEKELERHDIWNTISSHLQEHQGAHAFSITRLTKRQFAKQTPQGKLGHHRCFSSLLGSRKGTRLQCIYVSEAFVWLHSTSAQGGGQIPRVHQECQQKRPQQWREEQTCSPAGQWGLCGVMQMSQLRYTCVDLHSFPGSAVQTEKARTADVSTQAFQ